MGTHKVEHAIRNKLWRILFTGPFAEISGKLVNPVVVLEIGGVKVVRIALAVVAIEVIKPLPKRIPRAPLCSPVLRAPIYQNNRSSTPGP